VSYFTLGGGFRAAISRKRAANPRSDADICGAKRHVRFTPNSDRESGFPQKVMSALLPKADMRENESSEMKKTALRRSLSNLTQSGCTSALRIGICPVVGGGLGGFKRADGLEAGCHGGLSTRHNFVMIDVEET
jgi:hypothetical protein